jgi:hypothetical protein
MVPRAAPSALFKSFPSLGPCGFPGDTDLSGDRTRLPSRRLFQPLNGHILSPAQRNLQSSCRAQLAIPLLALKESLPIVLEVRKLIDVGTRSRLCGFRLGEGVFAPLIVAILISCLLAPVVSRLELRHFSHRDTG